MADTFVMSARQAAELDYAFERNGFTAAEVKQLSSGTILADVRKVLLGHASITTIEHLINLDANPFVPNGWKGVEEHQKGGQFKWDAAKVKFSLSKKQEGGSYIVGTKLREELKGKPVYNANLLDYLLAHPHLIPEDWKKDENGNTRYIFFWGTIYRLSDDGLCVRYLCWHVGRWFWSHYWLDNDWRGDNPAAVPAS